MSHKAATVDKEKSEPTQHSTDQLNSNGYYLDTQYLDGDHRDLKTTADGHTVLIPQPIDDPNDPLNWSNRKKHLILFVITWLAFLPDYGSSMGAVTLIPQANQWHLSENTIQHNLVGNLFCLGMGGLFTVALSSYFGRLPVLLFWQLMALGTGIWCAAAKSFNSFLAARIVNGFFAIAAQAGGLMWINDIFFFHERPRKINIWSGGVILSPYLGPFTAAFVIWKLSWRWAYWIYSILNGVGLGLILLIDETHYDRGIPTEQQPIWKSKALRMLGIERHPRGSFLRSVSKPFVAICKIPVALIVVYYFLNFAWIIGVNATISTWLTTFYGFSPKGLGLFYFSGITGSILGEVFGHWIHDMIGRFYIKRHNGRIDPEARLIICYLAGVLMAVGLLILGFALQYHWHWAYLAVFDGMQVAGINLATTAVNAYLLDSYPEGSGEVCAWITVGRTLGGFMATYIEIPWVAGTGAAKVFGVQTGITAAAMLIPLFLQLFGKKLRQLQGPMRFLGARKSA
ncbi:hypothetical protein M409DRAFT_57831 [Zasmidium cellare ATCC 36951]|uniref:Major facilitator superfamily (MFS) profile domain-containing protein n=1 Tax=Zasmidium cellare ATCC 36951 TaxID=1080233 RepID=A0A6A6CAB7_ZASCE|nr:uncharacterized protein M409DRAFT_57831 [Zasmidium cellare ATCC 36951]KAF2163170.1 hypothetical protein M409DRAFT_57831 [Zasmidium cellare ATCC 36951]